MTPSKPIAITLGDPAGIGPEIVSQAFTEAPQALRGCFVAGDAAALRRGMAAARAGGRPASTNADLNATSTGASTAFATPSATPSDVPPPIIDIHHPQQALAVPPGAVALLQVGASCDESHLPPWGQVSAQAGRMAGEAVVWAARAALRGEVAGLVTAPLHKAALAAAGLPYSAFAGHTELLQAEAAAFAGWPLAQMPVRMMLVSDELRTVLVSIHLSLRQALDAVTFDHVLQTIAITHASVANMLQKPPKIAVAGLNPHAGEGGRFGREERDILEPAIAAARAQGMDVHGPLPPDTVFMRARAAPGRAGEFDVVVAMYHDQGLIPVKYLGVDHGVNVTLGLHNGQGRTLVRTSPDHGTAFDIAGTGRASAASLLKAVQVARQMAGL